MTASYALRITVRGLLLLALCAFASASAVAQSATATLSGTVEDQNHAVVPGASVTAVNTGTTLERRTTTNSSGDYTIPLLPPGTYVVRVEAQGFAPVRVDNVVLNVGDQKALQIQLKAGDVNATVQVLNEAPLINESPAVGTVIDRRFVENLPLNGRSFNTLLQLTPGVVIAPSDNGGGNPGQFSIAGQRTDSNNFTVDGASVNFGVSVGTGSLGNSGTGSAQAFSVLGGTSSLVSVEALQEFRIETSSYAPEFGRQPGGQVILNTRSGTNDFHGAAFEYFRNTVFDANNWFANAAGLKRAAEHYNNFGGFLGGPIKKNKTFFFMSVEVARLRQPQTIPVLVPSAFARAFAATNAPALAPFLNAFPQPDDKTVTPGVYTSQFSGSFSNSGTLDAASIRIDHSFSNRVSLFGRFNNAPSHALSRGGASLSTLDDTTVDTRTLTVGVNMILTPRVSNTLRGNYSTQNAVESRSLDSFGGAVPPAPSVFLGSLSSASTSVTFSNDDTSAFPLQFGLVAKNHATQLNFVDDLSVVKGVHTLKFGGDYRAIYTNVAFPHNAVGLIADTVQAFLASSQLLALSGVTTAPTQFLSRALSLYAQDSWKVTPRLAMTYGVRWELNPAPKPRGATTFVAWQNLATPSQISLAPPGTPLWNTTHGNFAPRFGIAYRLTQRGDFILRGGAGLFYDLGVGESASVSAAFPNLVSAVVPSVAVPATNLASLLPSISLQPPFSGMMYAFSPDLKLPLSYQWNVALEKSFGGRQTVAATYVGQIGRRLLRQQGLAAPNSNFKAGSRFFVTANDSSSDYNALQLQYRRPLASRIQAILNYTWSHSLDDASSDIYIAVANAIISNKSDRGPSSFDVRHSFSGALSYDVPSATESGPLSLLTRGWTIDAVIVARSGFPFNAVALLRRLGPAIARPDLVPGQPVWISDPGAPGGRMLNPLAFKTPPPLRQGTEGRNDIPGFGLWQVDLSIGRKFPLTERINLQFRADAFNLFNHPNFSNPLGIFISPASTTFLRSRTMANVALGGLNPLFQEGGPRSLQFSLRLSF